MRFVCDSCRAQYMISDEKVGAKGVKVRCKKCGYVILVRRAEATPPPEPDGEATQVMQLPVGFQTGGAFGGDEPEVTSPGGTPHAAPSLGADKPEASGLFSGVEEDEIGAVFDQVLNSGNHKIPSGDAPAADDSDDETQAGQGHGLGESPDDRMSTRVLDGDTMRKLAAEASGAPAKTDDSADEGKAKAAPSNDWYVAIDEKQEGPLGLERLKELWEQGEVGPDSLCWRAGMADWIPVSEVRELASALAPRPAKPVIVAPEPMAAAPVVASMPVESAFSAGGVSRSIRSDVPVMASGPSEPSKGGWKPSAASALASLVQEEIQVLSKPAPKAEEAAPALVPGLLDLPAPAAEPSRATHAGAMAPPAAAQLPIGAAAALTPAPAPYVPAPAQAPYAAPNPYAASYGHAPLPPPPQESKPKIGLFVGLGVGAVVLLAFAILGAAAIGKNDPPPQQLVAAAPVAPTPVAQPPAAVAPPAPAPVEPPVAAGVQPAAAVEPPKTEVAAAPPEPVKEEPPAKVERPVAVAKVERPTTTKRTTTTRSRDNDEDDDAIVAPAPKKTTTGSDEGDFDSVFGTSSKKSNSGSGSTTKPASASVYIPPAPGSADIPESLGQADIMQVVLANKAGLAKCSADYKKENGGASGKIAMRWNILTSGKTSAITCETADLKGSSLATCLTGQIKKMQFPKHKRQGDPIVFPFSF